MNRGFQRFSGLLMIGLLIFTSYACMLEILGHASTVDLKNSFGSVTYQANPYIYTAGAVTSAKIVEEENLRIEVNPLGTYQGYRETIQFCGSPIAQFEDKANPVVITYSRQAHRKIDGLACHQLIRVDEVTR